jgi:hypothetical protein
MLKNVTLSAEQELIEAARDRAHRERTTLNNAFREWLARFASRNDNGAEYRKLMRSLKHISAGKKFSRDDFNER